MPEPTHENERIADSRAYEFNLHCYCITLDRKALNESLQRLLVDAGSEPSEFPDFGHLFSNTPVFVPSSNIAAMERIVQAIESATELPSFRERVLSWAPKLAQFNPGPIGAFMGYDFHLGPDGPRLIEINTNAGGRLTARGKLPFWPISGTWPCCQPLRPYPTGD